MATGDLIYADENGGIGFGDHTLPTKAKRDNFQYDGDVYKVKTSKEMTKLEKNELFFYESVPGTTVSSFKETEQGIEFLVEGYEDVQIILGLSEVTEYEVYINDNSIGKIESSVGGKPGFSVDLTEEGKKKVKVAKVSNS